MRPGTPNALGWWCVPLKPHSSTALPRALGPWPAPARLGLRPRASRHAVSRVTRRRQPLSQRITCRCGDPTMSGAAAPTPPAPDAM